MDSVVTALTSDFTVASALTALAAVAPILGVGLIVAFAYAVLRWVLSNTAFWGGNVRDTVSNYRHRNDWD